MGSNVSTFVKSRKNSITQQRIKHILSYIMECHRIFLSDGITYSKSEIKASSTIMFEDYFKMDFVENYLKKNKLLGINGIGRIGKLTLWNQLQIGNFEGYILNTGRKVGKSLSDIVDFLTTDSTYGSINNFFYGSIKQFSI